MNKQEIERAIRILKMYSSHVADINIDAKNAFTMAISALEQQLTNGWIPVSEPPERRRHESGEPIEFNVMLRYGAVATTGCIDNDGVWGWMDWCKLKFNPFGVDVLYWQPLPKILAEVSE